MFFFFFVLAIISVEPQLGLAGTPTGTKAVADVTNSATARTYTFISQDLQFDSEITK